MGLWPMLEVLTLLKPGILVLSDDTHYIEPRPLSQSALLGKPGAPLRLSLGAQRAEDHRGRATPDGVKSDGVKQQHSLGFLNVG